MNKEVKKFIDYLDKSVEDIKCRVIERVAKRRERTLLAEDDIDFEKISERKNVKRLLSVPEEEWPLHTEVFIDFQYISEMLEESPLNGREMFAIVLRILEKNLATNIANSEMYCFDIKATETYKFSYMSRDEFMEFVRSDQYGILREKDVNELTLHERKMLEEFERFSEANPLNISSVVDGHRTLQESYFSKRDSYTEEDVEEFIQVLRDFGTYESLLEIFRQIMLKEVGKRQKNTFVEPKSTPKVNREEDKKVLSKKEYNLLLRELREYFDIRTMEKVQPLDLDKQIYCVSLLIRLGFSEEKIKGILKVINKDNDISCDNPVSMLIALFGKLSYYREIPGIGESLELMVSALNEMMMIGVSDSDYIEWKNLIGEELEHAMSLVPKTYEYEIEEGKKYSKNK